MYYLVGKLGLIGNFLWLGLRHGVVAMPIVLLILLSALHAVDPNLELARAAAANLATICPGGPSPSVNGSQYSSNKANPMRITRACLPDIQEAEFAP
jgi:hypothetical protein